MVAEQGEKVAVVCAAWDSVKTEAFNAYIRLISFMTRYLPPGHLLWACSARNPTHKACTSLISQSLEKGADWILYMDDDVCPPYDVFPKLREVADPENRPIVCALSHFRYPPFWPSIFKYEGWPGIEAPSIAKPMPVMEYPKNQVIQVDATGLCCSLIHKSVFEKIDKPWFDWKDEYTPDGWFMYQVAIKKIPVFVHTGVEVDHLGTILVNSETYAKYVNEVGLDKVTETAVERFRLAGVTKPDEAKMRPATQNEREEILKIITPSSQTEKTEPVSL